MLVKYAQKPWIHSIQGEERGFEGIIAEQFDNLAI
jgi:hypothetical protein